MSKFIKKITKSKKNPRNILVLGTGFERLEELCNSFSSIFIISTTEQVVRKRNLIYKENFDHLELLPDIDVIVMDRDQDLHVSKLPQLLSRYQPIILVQGIELFGKTEYKFLKNYGYAVTQIFNDCHLWRKLN
jgi:hypothetical protein